MTKNKTKKTILVSLVAMLICVAMLTGVTYALFQKSVTSVDNIISTGVYNVSIQWSNTFNGPYADLGTAPIFSASDLKPGDTVVRYIKLTNSNAYDVDASLTIPALTGTNELAQYLDVYVNTNATTELTTTGTSAGKFNTLANSNYVINGETTITLAAKSGDTPTTQIVAIGFKVGEVPTTNAALTATFNLTVLLAQHQAQA